MDYVVCIPSYNRVNILKNKTINTLEQNNINKDIIYIYVVKEQYEDYKLMFPNYNVVVGEKGLLKQRDFILTQHKLKNIVFLDDDITKFVIKNDNKTDDFLNFDSVIKLAFRKCVDNKTKLWGIYNLDNGFYMKDKITTDLKLIAGGCYGVINDTINSFMLWNNDIGEDYARTLHYYNLYNSVVRINYIGLKVNIWTTKGGLQDIYTKEERIQKEYDAFAKLNTLYPNLTKIMKPKKNGHSRLKLHHYKNFTSSSP